ncbi:MAG TPA: hypothetical protein VFG15_03020 [Amycolatopsis sp.]|nr:hypothetical protein [Amycolatopsis sp.]
MPHFPVSVVVEGGDVDEALGNINIALAPFDESLRIAPCTDGRATCLGNPDGTWRWYMVGGRNSGQLRLRADAHRQDYDTGHRFWMAEPVTPGVCDLGRIRALDLAGMRGAAAAQAVRDWDEYQTVVTGTPKPQPLAQFLDRATAAADVRRWMSAGLDRTTLKQWIGDPVLGGGGRLLQLTVPDPAVRPVSYGSARAELEVLDAAWDDNAYTVDQAHADYAAQPRIAALRGNRPYQGTEVWPEYVFDHLSRDDYTQLQRARAIPGFATVTHGGQWLEGRQDHRGTPDSPSELDPAYLEHVNTYLDNLPDDHWLAIVTCHT